MVMIIKIYLYTKSISGWLLVGFMLTLMSSCRSKVENTEVQRVIEDSELFSKSGQIMDSTLSNDKVTLKYHSITKDQFYKALGSVNYTIGYFTRNHSIGEKLGVSRNRIGDTLRIDLKSDSLLVNTEVQYPTRYFYENQVGNYHMVKKLSFEDAKTMFLSDECDTKVMEGIAAVSNKEGNLLFSSSNEQEMKWDSTQVSLIQINGCSIDTLISCNPHWFSNFSFFTDKDELYLAHAKVNGDGSYTITPVRMEVLIK